MASPASTHCFRCSTSAAALILAALALAAARPARACGWSEPSIEDETTFDPAVLGDQTPAGLFYDPHRQGFGDPCQDCARQEMLADWGRYLGAAVKTDDWAAVLFDADLDAIDGLIFYLQKKRPAAPAGFEMSSVIGVPEAERGKLISALFFVGFARRVEPFAALPPPSWDESAAMALEARRRASGDPRALLKNGEKALARAGDPFMKQRYAFQILRLSFYLDDWGGTESFFARNTAILDGPSPSLRARARYYLAGALARLGQRGRANLELARLHTAFAPIAGAAVQDFQPQEQSDWQAALGLAKSVREKTELWRLVGLKLDAVAAIEAIVALDPASGLVALLAVRELARGEQASRDLGALGSVAVKLADARTTDRPWLWDLVAGHAAALRGDLALARPRLERAQKRGPKAAASQARASLALALAAAWRPDEPAVGEELARTLAAIDPSFGRLPAVTRRVRAALARTSAAAGRAAEAELLVPSPVWTPRPSDIEPWTDPAFVQELIARVAQPKTGFDRLVAGGSGTTREQLEKELALLYLVKGDFVEASRIFTTTKAKSEKLGTNPFVMHLRDCHDCDHAAYGDAPWTHKSFVARLVELERVANSKGPAAAKAAFELGAALYNITYHGNARSVLAGTHSLTADTAPAERWFKRAHDLSVDRELKAEAALMAAKCELVRAREPAAYEDRSVGSAATWYPAARELADTAYYKEALRECGWLRAWDQRQGR